MTSSDDISGSDEYHSRAQANCNCHPSNDIVGSKGNMLAGKHIVLALTGSIACVKAFELCRELMRQGATVNIVMSSAATRIIHPEAMQYASGNPVCTQITGNVEHIEFFGDKGRADLLLIAPATANTIGKIAWGWDDTAPTTFATTALGSKAPVIIVPAMHYSMYSHPIVKENIKNLKKIGIKFVEPKISEGKAKFPELGEIVLEAARTINMNSNNAKLKNKRILITAGSLRERIDPIRFISTPSSGSMGIELAKAAYAQGAHVCIAGSEELLNCKNQNSQGAMQIPKQIPIIDAKNFDEMNNVVLKELKSKKYDYFISAAAISDFSVKMQKEKIRSNKKIKLQLVPTPKLIVQIRKKFPKLKIIAFKAETNKTNAELEKLAKEFLQKNRFEMVIANDVAKGTIGKSTANLVIAAKGANIRTLAGPKSSVAQEIISSLP